MPLFDQFQRVENRAKRQNEGTFDYLNISAGRAVGAMRDLLEGWYDNLPPGAQPDIRGRFRNGNQSQHEGAFLELFWHQTLRCLGYRVEIHPDIRKVETAPDFLAHRGGCPRFYLEATTAMPPGDPAAARRIAEMHDTLNRTDSPDFFLEMQYRGNPEGNVRGRALRDKLEEWVRCLNYDEIRRVYDHREYASLPTFNWSEDSLTLTFTPIPKGPENRGRPGIRTIGIDMRNEIRPILTEEDIRSALEGKASKYGEPDLPLIVAINVMDDFCDDDAVWVASMGFVPCVGANARWQDMCNRAPEAGWRGPNGPRNTAVSAMVVTHQLSPSNIRGHVARLVHNPWAANPLPADSLPLVQYTIQLPGGEMNVCQETSPAEILGIPDPWPIAEVE